MRRENPHCLWFLTRRPSLPPSPAADQQQALFNQMQQQMQMQQMYYGQQWPGAYGFVFPPMLHMLASKCTRHDHSSLASVTLCPAVHAAASLASL